jgi:hypothetical protein
MRRATPLIRRAVPTALGAVLLILAGMAVNSPGYAEESAAGLADADATSAAPPPDGFESWQEVWSMQERLNSAADEISSAARAAGGDGLAGIVADPEERAVRLYWHGAMPDAVEVTVAEADVPVRTFAARYGAEELAAQARRLVEDGDTGSPRITSAAPMFDGSGIEITVDGPAAAGYRHPAVQALTTRNGAGPRVQVRSAPALDQTSRWNDNVPFYGGAAIQFSSGSGCSTGFAVRRLTLGFIPHSYGLLTAGHCGSTGDRAVNGNNISMGLVTDDYDSRDIMIVGNVLDLPLVGGRMYDGGVHTGEFTKPVKGTMSSHVGNFVCTSGAYSGARCNIKVTHVNQAATNERGQVVWPLVRAAEQSGQNAAGEGDSGGPVFGLSGSQNENVIAAGTIVGGMDQVPCTGITDRACYSTMYYADIIGALDHFDTHIVTG